MQKNDYVKIEGQKLDYYSFLKRRKRTVDNFVSEYNISSIEDFHSVMKSLENEFVFSDEFYNLVKNKLSLKIEIFELQSEEVKPKKRSVKKDD